MSETVVKTLGNHGQVLVLFVILLPLILLGIFGLAAYGSMLYEEKKLTNIAHIACNYAYGERSYESIENIIIQNDSKVEHIELKEQDSSTKVVLEKEIPILFINQNTTVRVVVDCKKQER